MGFLLSLLRRMMVRSWVRAGANAYQNSGKRHQRQPKMVARWECPSMTISPDEDALNRRIDARVRREMANGTYDGPGMVNQGRGPLRTSRPVAAVKANGGLRGGATRNRRLGG